MTPYNTIWALGIKKFGLIFWVDRAQGLLREEKSAVSSLLNIGRDLIPTNIVAAAAQSNYMGVITFAIVFACALNSYGVWFVNTSAPAP